MEWLVLVIVVPLVLVPLVLLFGFAGCGELLDASPVGTAAPTATGLTAKTVFFGNESRINLAWIGDPNAATYHVLRAEDGNVPTFYEETSAVTFTDAAGPGLPGPVEGTTYVYQVMAVTSAGTSGSLSNEARATALPAAPKLLEAVPVAQDRIEVKWLRMSAHGTLFHFERRKRPAGLRSYTPTDELNIDEDVDEGDEYEYRVFDIVVDGYDESVKQKVLSPPSNMVVGKPLAFAAAFGVAQPQPDLHNFCLIQRIRVTGTGTKIRLTIAGSGSGLTLDRIYISQIAAGGNPWDAAAPPTAIVQAPVTLAPGELARTFDWIDFVIPAAPLDLLVAFDINPVAGQGNVRFANIPGVQHYFMSYAQNPGVPRQAEVQDRVPTFNTGVGRHYLVEKLEVL